MVHQDCLDHTIPRTKKLCNLTKWYRLCMHLMGCVNNVGMGWIIHDTLCVVNRIPQHLRFQPFLILDLHNFFYSSLLGFPAVFVCCTRDTHYNLWGEMCSKTGTWRNCAINGNFQSHQMPPYFTFHAFNKSHKQLGNIQWCARWPFTWFPWIHQTSCRFNSIKLIYDELPKRLQLTIHKSGEQHRSSNSQSTHLW